MENLLPPLPTTNIAGAQPGAVSPPAKRARFDMRAGALPETPPESPQADAIATHAFVPTFVPITMASPDTEQASATLPITPPSNSPSTDSDSDIGDDPPRLMAGKGRIILPSDTEILLTTIVTVANSHEQAAFAASVTTPTVLYNSETRETHLFGPMVLEFSNGMTVIAIFDGQSYFDVFENPGHAADPSELEMELRFKDGTKLEHFAYKQLDSENPRCSGVVAEMLQTVVCYMEGDNFQGMELTGDIGDLEIDGCDISAYYFENTSLRPLSFEFPEGRNWDSYMGNIALDLSPEGIAFRFNDENAIFTSGIHRIEVDCTQEEIHSATMSSFPQGYDHPAAIVYTGGVIFNVQAGVCMPHGEGFLEQNGTRKPVKFLRGKHIIFNTLKPFRQLLERANQEGFRRPPGPSPLSKEIK
ncbi:MAG: hypothetical protein O3A01_04540 [bacterium]|nr:hypothetical protein [bacterium]